MIPAVCVTLELVEANPEYFAFKGSLKHGVLYFLKSEVTGKVDPRPYYTSENTDVIQLRTYFRRFMVYQPKDFNGPWIMHEYTLERHMKELIWKGW